MIASEGPAVASDIANAAPILDTSALISGGIIGGISPNPPLEPGQLDASDVLLAKSFWPWDDLGARGIPEHWLYMSRRIQGVIAMLSVQTANGPKLVLANPDGSLFTDVKQLSGDVWATRDTGINALINQHVPAVGAKATFTTVFDPPAIAVIDTIICSLTQVSGAASTVGVTVQVNGVEWGPFSMGVLAAVGSVDRLILSNLKWRSPSNNATLTVAFSLALAGIQEAVYAYGRQE